MLVVIPLVFALLPGVTLDSGWAWVPLTNIALAMKELFKGTMDYYALLNIFLSTCAVAAVFIGFAYIGLKRKKYFLDNR
jgi:sodium transport system permease protein